MPTPVTELVNHHAIPPAAVVLGGIANGFAWAQSVNTGTVVTFCTIAVPAIVGGVVYAIKNIGPVWLDFLKAREKIRSESLATQMDALSKSLTEAKARGEAERQTALGNAKRAEANEQRADDLAALVTKLSTQIASLNEKAEANNAKNDAINRKLHDTLNLLTAAESRAINAELDRKEMMDAVRHNGDISEEVKAAILKVYDAANSATQQVVAKADQVVGSLDTLIQSNKLTESHAGD